MATTSSLLKSAKSTRERIQAYEDDLVAFEWENSAKTADDWINYRAYLEDRGRRATDPSKALTIARKLRTAENQFVSQEIERVSIDILEGRATTTEKYNVMKELYYRAAERGNFDLAQNLLYRLDSLNIQIQNEQERAQRVAGTMANNQVKTLGKLMGKMQKETDFISLADGTIVKPLKMLDQELKTGGDTATGFWADAATTLEAMYGLVEDAYVSATTQEAVDKIEADYGDLLRGEKTFKIGGQSLTFPEVKLAYESANANNPIYSPVITRDPTTGETNYKLVKNKIDDFVWTRDDDGLYTATPVRAKNLSPFQTLDAQITDEGNIVGQSYKKDGRDVANIKGGSEQVSRNEALSIKNRLLSQGIIAEGGTDGQIKITLPDGRVYENAVIMPDGTIRYFGEPGEFSGGQSGLFEINTLNGKIREVAPDETSDFGEVSAFGGYLSKPSEAGERYVKSLAGLSPVTRVQPVDLDMDKLSGFGSPLLAGSIRLGNDFSGRGEPVTTELLQGARVKRAQAAEALFQHQQAQIQAQAEAQKQLQQSNAPGLQQTPVRAFSVLSGAPVRQIKVKPLPVRTAPIRVNVAPSSNKPISVGNARTNTRPIKVGY